MFRLQSLSLVVVILLLAGCVVPFGIQVAPSGSVVTKDYDLGNFSAVAAGSAFQVEITRSDKYSVSVTVNENLVERLGCRHFREYAAHLPETWHRHHRRRTLKAKVTMPELTGLDLSGASHTTLAGFESDNNSQGRSVWGEQPARRSDLRRCAVRRFGRQQDRARWQRPGFEYQSVRGEHL